MRIHGAARAACVSPASRVEPAVNTVRGSHALIIAPETEANAPHGTAGNVGKGPYLFSSASMCGGLYKSGCCSAVRTPFVFVCTGGCHTIRVV